MAVTEEAYKKALAEIEEHEEIVSRYKNEQYRIERDNVEWGLGYKRKDFVLVMGPYFIDVKIRMLRSSWIGATNIEEREDIKCKECLLIIIKILSGFEDLVVHVFVKEFEDVRRTMSKCTCGRCILLTETYMDREEYFEYSAD